MQISIDGCTCTNRVNIILNTWLYAQGGTLFDVRLGVADLHYLIINKTLTTF